MIDRSDLWQAGADALRELGLRRWKVWYADEEPETMVDRRNAPRTAYNLRFSIVTDDGRFLNVRFRLPADQIGETAVTCEWVKNALAHRIRRDHLPSVQ